MGERRRETEKKERERRGSETDVPKLYTYNKYELSVIISSDLGRFFMCTLVSRDRIPFSKYVKYHVYPGHQGTNDITLLIF